MGIFASREEVAVELESCHCDGSPHDHDTVWLWAELTPDGGLAATAAVNRSAPDARTLEGIIGQVWLIHGISRWTFVDDKGQPIRCDPFTISRLDWEIVKPVAEKANELYAEKFMRPLVARLSRSSRNGRTGTSTSRTAGTSRKSPKP